MKVTLRNDFHGRQAVVRVPDSVVRGDESKAWAAWSWIQAGVFSGDVSRRRQYQRLHRALCGAGDCACGVVRGPQE